MLKPKRGPTPCWWDHWPCDLPTWRPFLAPGSSWRPRAVRPCQTVAGATSFPSLGSRSLAKCSQCTPEVSEKGGAARCFPVPGHASHPPHRVRGPLPLLTPNHRPWEPTSQDPSASSRPLHPHRPGPEDLICPGTWPVASALFPSQCAAPRTALLCNHRANPGSADDIQPQAKSHPLSVSLRPHRRRVVFTGEHLPSVRR